MKSTSWRRIAGAVALALFALSITLQTAPERWYVAVAAIVGLGLIVIASVIGASAGPTEQRAETPRSKTYLVAAFAVAALVTIGFVTWFGVYS